MSYENLAELKALYNDKKNLIPQETLKSYLKAFSIEYTHQHFYIFRLSLYSPLLWHEYP